ncbi:MAG: hypothetical protein LBG78_03490 [Azoarcus sp.]|jgi:uncharacterized protein YycO|nr:hypothetical protein [Azoarcus sp.]
MTLFVGAMCAVSARAEVSLAEMFKPAHCADAPRLPPYAEMQDALRDYIRLSEEALAMRASAIKIYHELAARKQDSRPLNGEELQRISEGAAALVAQREALFKIALAHECWIVPPFKGDASDIQRVGVLMSLSAALTLYDNYLSAITLYRSDGELRRLLNTADQGYALGRGELQKAELIYTAPMIRSRVRKAIQWFDKYGKGASNFEGYDYLYQSVAQSPSKNLVGQINPLHAVREAFEVFGDFSLDSLLNGKNQVSHYASLAVGNTTGLVETRKGKLFGRPNIEQSVASALKAGDILLEKTPFRLTDQFIPGHWGHAALWVGTEQELTALGIWNHDLVRPHQATIRAGRGIVEALRSGVEMNDIAHFLNVDDLAVLRRSDASKETRRHAILQALRQVGKEYDFNFDAESIQRMYCSKLVYYAYGDIQWPTSQMLGRYTVSPDDIARRSLNGGPLAIVLLYHDGKAVTPEQPVMERFLASGR